MASLATDLRDGTFERHDDFHASNYSLNEAVDFNDFEAALQHFANNRDSASPSLPELPSWDAVPISNLPDEPGSSVANSGYDLRIAPRINGGSAYSTWLDQDATSTYDPASKLDPGLRPPTEIIEGRKRNRLERPEEDPNRPKVPKTFTWQNGRYQGKRLPVTLSLRSERGKAVLRAYGAALDNWPKSAYQLPDQEADWASWWNSGLTSTLNDSSPDHNGSFGDRTRKRPELIHQHDDDAAQSLEDLKLGHPAARGCKACFLLHEACPLLEEGSRYPCDICAVDDVDCELVLEPVKKSACLNCGKKRICCSYRDEGSNHALPCKSCNNRGLKCLAGPASGRTRTGPSLDLYPHTVLGAGFIRTFATCTQCRKAKNRCSRKNKLEAGTDPCKACLENNLTCTYEPIQKTTAGARCLEKTVDQAHNLPGSRPRASTTVTQFIKTKFAHPIEMNYGGPKQCHWCEDLVYGLLGLAEVTVEVMDFNDGHGYVELEGGHFGAGHDASRMCGDCTFDRLLIASCVNHKIKQIEGADPETFDHDSVMDFMMPGMAAIAPFAWCSVCPAPASFACCKEIDLGMGEEDKMELVGEQKEQKGCGLKLCESCAFALVNEKEGNLEALVGGILEQDEGGFGVRADVDFLLPGGELVRRIGGT